MKKPKVANKEFQHFGDTEIQKESLVEHGKIFGKMRIETASQSQRSRAGTTDQSGDAQRPWIRAICT